MDYNSDLLILNPHFCTTPSINTPQLEPFDKINAMPLAVFIRIPLRFILMFGCRQINRKRKIASRKQACIGHLSFLFTLLVAYSNSIVAGGFPVQSYMTLFTPFTSFTILLVTLASTSHGICAASAVMKSEVFTALSATA